MIFKKIYTFLNNIFNGNSFSKLFLASILILFSSFVAFELKTTFANNLKDNIESTATAVYVNSVLTTGDSKNEFHILYTKAGLQPIKIYTSYLPPANTYERDSTPQTQLANEHTLRPCEIMVPSGLEMIGNDCMIKIPFDCGSPAHGTVSDPGVNCLYYNSVFKTFPASKNFEPKECTATLQDKRTCLSTDKPYCHNIDNPILGINCKLAPCNAIPNQKYRRPGVNCMVDCNDTSNKHITENKFFMEGFNCLSSCKTAANKVIGQNCVLEFNEYVMPLCNKDDLFRSAKFFNKSSNAFFPREQCLDVIDLPLCTNPSTETIMVDNCVNECDSNGVHGTSCINFDSSVGSTYTNKKCHHYKTSDTLNANTNCAKLNCHNLSITELARSLNAVDFSIPTISNQKYCTPTKYTNFSFKQFKAINLNSPETAYLRDYQLDNKPCYSLEDTEAIETILSSSFYGGNTDSTGATNNKITFLKKQCTKTNAITGCTDDIVNRAHSQFNPHFLYDKNSFCKFINVPEEISCTDYNKSPIGTPPFDCNASNQCSFANGDCITTDICKENIDGDKSCYKNDINCNLSVNKKYKICQQLNTSSAKTDNSDPYVSWFFRPTISPKSLIDATGGGKKLVNMTGYPVTDTKDISSQNDYLKTTISNLWANGKVSATISNGSEVPGASDYDAGVRAVGPANICGMNSNFRGIPSDDFAYFRGDVKTTYELDDKISHSVDICIRYVSSSSLTQSCGHRNCLNNCAFIFNGNTGVCTKICGYDVCKTLSIVEGPKERIRNCASNMENFIRLSRDIASGTKRIIGFDKDECIKTYETSSDIVSRNTRVRIFKPESSNYICAVAEFTDITTASLSKPYFDGDEFFSVPDGKGGTKKLCVSGTYVESTDSCENGFDTNQMDINSRVWRTAKIIKYIQAPPMDYTETQGLFPTGLSEMKSKHIDPITGQEVNQTIGRVDFNTKRYFETSDCIKHKNRISSPVLFSKATLINSERLFLPNVIIEGVCNVASPEVSPTCETPVIAGKTDFLKPAIKILYGKKGASTNLSNDQSSLFHNYKIIDIDGQDSNTSGSGYVIKPFNIGIQDTDRIVKKVTLLKESRYDENSNSKLKPVACLYAKKNNPAGGAGAGGADDKGDFIGCVDRKRATSMPIINAKTAAAASNYFNLEFQVGFTATYKSDIQLNNLSNDIKNKSNLRKCVNIESQGYKICIERDECSLLNIECVDNEKSLIDELQDPDQHMLSIPSRQATSNYCKNELLIKCNEKKGLTDANTGGNTRYKTLDPDPTHGFNRRPTDDNYYGWYNEVCVVEGFENLDDPDKIVYVQNKAALSNGVKASCIKKPGLTKAQCDSCNNAADTGCTKIGCCQIVSPDTDNSRPATPHELGYCVENTNYKKYCPAIKYFEKNSDTSDMYFTSQKNLDPVHVSHINRNNNTPINGVAQRNSYGHAEYEIAYEGNNNIAGACNGFFKKPINNFPSANCTTSGWDNFRGGCEQYSCPARTIPSYGANITGNYESNYDATTIDGSKRGSLHGYASNWPETTITDLSKKTIDSGATCILGYKKVGETKATIQRDLLKIPTLSQNQDSIDSLFGAVSYEIGGINPSRKCNQVGEWESVINPCERITCPALNFPEPTESNALDLNEFGTVTTLTRPYKIVIYASKMNPGLGLTKVKFKISQTIDGLSPDVNIYLNANSARASIDGDTANDFIIKNRDNDSNVNSIQSDKIYVLQKVSNYWKILNNDDDEKLKLIWERSGGASFPSAKAIRSNLFYYNNLTDIEDKHTVTGVCGAGYNQLAGTPPPELTCDSKGNWTLLKNRCVSECKEVNSPVADDPSHGFATWRKIDRMSLDSTKADSSACSSGYIPYPYTPIYDDQGVVKFPYKALPGDQGFEKYSYSNQNTIPAEISYDAITSYLTDTYSATVSAPSPENFNGTYYNLKIGTTGSGGGNALGIKVFYLTNSNLTPQSPDDTKWSRIKFASFGKPTYQSGEATKNESCHNPLSKYIVAKKCINNNSCNLQKSDFTSGFTCSSPTNFGNGVDGANDVDGDEFGAMGGNGGGNNSGNYNSYYDHKFHDIDSKTIPTFTPNENNFGKAVDLTETIQSPNQFDGRPGSVIIEEYSDLNFSNRIRNIEYIVPQEATSHTISGTAGSGTIIYVKYTIIGGGGGGGGPGNAKGSNGTGGSKIVGYFKVEAGTVLKIYVGGGGKAGKQGNTPGAVSSLNPQIIQPIKIFNSTKETNFAKKILKGIGEFFVSEAYALITDNLITDSFDYSSDCKITNQFGFKDKNVARAYPTGSADCDRDYTSGKLHYRCSLGTISGIDNQCYCINGYHRNGLECDSNGPCSLSAGNGYVAVVPTYPYNALWGVRKNINCNAPNYTGTFSYYCPNTTGTGYPNVIITQNNCTPTNCSSSQIVSNNICVNKSCKLPITAGFPKESDGTGKSVEGAGNINCESGYNGSISYTCSTNGGTATTSGTCLANSCKLPTTIGFPRENNGTGKDVSGVGSINCASGYSGLISYDCTTNSGTATTSGTCSANSCKLPTNTGFPRESDGTGKNVSGAGSITCESGYRNGQATSPTYFCNAYDNNEFIQFLDTEYATTSGTCVVNSCKLPENTGFPKESDGTGKSVEGAGNINCASGYSGSISYACTTDSVTATTSGTCNLNSCKLPTTIGFPRENNGTGKDVSGVGSINCASGYSGSISYACTTDSVTATTSGTCNLNSCILPTTAGFPTENDGTGKIVEGAGSITCTSGYRKGEATDPTYSCGISGSAPVGVTATISGTCALNYCTLPGNTGFPTGASASVSGIGSVTCASGYENGPIPPTYTCATNGGTATINTGGTCKIINCTVTTVNPSDPYLPQTFLAYTSGTNTGTFDCKEGYYGTVSYTCSTTGEAQNLTPNCIRIKCTLPESGISKVDGGRIVDFTKEDVEYSCASGYRSLIDINKPKYKCVGHAPKTNPSAITITNECSLITCDYNYAGVNYLLTDAQMQTIACDRSLGYIGSFNISCSDRGILSTASSDCRMISCNIPNNLNTKLIHGAKVFFTGNEYTATSCQEGYFYSTSCQDDDLNCGIPRYRCLNNTETINGTFEFQGSCSRIRCDLPSTGDSALNSILDGTSVDWTGNSFVDTTCKTGFYKGQYEPAYLCNIGGYSTINKCLPIMCNLEAGLTYSSRTNLEYGENKIIDCNKEGYSGTITYNCRTPVTSYFQGFPLGTITTSNINCLPKFRVRGANNDATFTAYTTSNASAPGGESGKITSSITFLKGGNGGNSPSFGSGGGGGSASMITIDDRIIAIAGGGKGGKGGGSLYVSEPSIQAPEMTQTLYSSVLGNYLLLEMEYSDSSIIGLISGKTSSSDIFSLASPAATFFNDIVYSLFGNPTLDEADNSLTPGSCNLNPPSRRLDECVGKSSCNLNSVSSLCSGGSCSCVDPKLIALASYSSGKPKLSLTRGSGASVLNCDLRELTPNGALIAAQIEIGKVYSIIINGNTCIKHNYLGDDYSITGTAENIIFATFPEPNNTFSPRIKIDGTYYGILRPESQAGSGIYRRVTIGYIDKNKEYALIKKTGSKIFYIIQEKMTENDATLNGIDPPKPKRTCMVDFSLNNNIDIMWSRPNSSCINQCPSYKDDPRVGAGRTNRGPGFIKWDRANFGEEQIKKFNGNRNADDSYQEINTELNPTNFKKDRTNNDFVLLRKCGPNGAWESQVYDLCVTSGGTDSSKVPANGINSFITNSSGSKTRGTEKFAIAANNEEVITGCLSGYEPQTNQKTFTGSILPQLKYKCVMNSGSGKAEFHPVPNTFDCVKYCSTSPSELSGGAFGKISPTGSIVKVRPYGDIIYGSPGGTSDGLHVVSCASGFVKKRGADGSRTVDPKITCNKSGDGSVSWSLTEDCEPPARCNVSTITRDEGSRIPGGAPDWFPGLKYIESEHRLNGMAHGNKKTFTPDTSKNEKFYGKCGYCKWREGWDMHCQRRYYYVRKYLKSYQCDDGAWSFDWSNEDTTFRKACDSDDWDHATYCFGVTESGENHPSKSYLGECSGGNKITHDTFGNLEDY